MTRWGNAGGNCRPQIPSPTELTGGPLLENRNTGITAISSRTEEYPHAASPPAPGAPAGPPAQIAATARGEEIPEPHRCPRRLARTPAPADARHEPGEARQLARADVPAGAKIREGGEPHWR